MCRSQISLRKFIKLIGAWFFYNWTIYFIFIFSGFESLSFNGILSLFFPFGIISTNFVACYVLFFLFIPFLNILLNNLNEKQHIRLIMLCCLIYVIIGSIPTFYVAMNYVSLFICLYFISSYIRLYPKDIFENQKFWKCCTLLTVGLSISSILGMCLGSSLLYGRLFSPSFFIVDANKPFAVLTALSLFIYFKNLKIQYISSINIIATSTFGVLLIHTNSLLAPQLWYNVVKGSNYYYSPCMPLHCWGSVLAVFFVCVLIDQVRITLIEKPFFRFYDSHREAFMVCWGRIDKKIWNKMGIEVEENNALKK